MQEHEEDPFDIIWKKYLAKISCLINVRSFVNLLLFILGIYLTRFANQHYNSGGCDGGICGIYLFIHGIPFFLSWIISWLLWATQANGLAAKWIWFLSVTLNIISGGFAFSAELDGTFIPGLILISAQTFLGVKLFVKD